MPALARTLTGNYVQAMCGRVIQSSGPLRYAIVDGMNVRDSRVHNYPPRWNAAPSQDLLVIRRNHKTGEVSLDPLRWGLIPYWCDDPKGGRKPINAKCESVRELQQNEQLAIISVMNLVDRIARIRIELKDIDPTIWRRVEVPLTTSLKGLHDVIQAVMPFENYHLFLFDVGDKRYGISDPEWDHVRATLDAKNIKLGALVERGVSAFSYTYDFGDDWRHSITIEGITAADPTLDYPRFIDGSRRAPPEDVGGIPGFEEFLDAMTKPHHPEHQRLTEWYGGSFDPDDLNLPVISGRISKLARRRALGKAGFVKSRGPTH